MPEQPPLRRVVVAVGSLRCGGAERAAGLLAGGLAERGHATSLVTLAGADEDFFPVAPEVRRIGLGLTGPSTNTLQALRTNRERLRALRAVLAAERPDVVVSFLRPVNALVHLAARPLGLPLVLSERIDPRRHHFPFAWRVLGWRAYRRCELVVANSPAVAAWMAEALGHGRVACIPNWVEPRPAGGADPLAGAARPRVVSVGRLSPQKGQAHLVRAMARRGGAASLAIAGEGPERERLQALAAELDLGPRVRFLGATPDVGGLLAAADVFAFPSLYEGMPNALLEAMAAGLAIVGYDSAAGTGELIEDGTSGLLVALGDEEAFAEALGRLLADPDLRARLGAGAREAARPYERARVLPLWEAALEQAIALRGGTRSAASTAV